jgi:hypothetical protein
MVTLREKRISGSRGPSHGFDTEAASLGCCCEAPPLAMADCAVSTDMLGEAGTAAASPFMRMAAAMWCAAVATGGRMWHVVAVEMAEARETGMRHRPFPCRYCMAVPVSSSISLATCCSVTARPSLPAAAPPPLPCTCADGVRDGGRLGRAVASFHGAARGVLWRQP